MAFVYGFNIGPKLLGVDLTAKHTTAQHPLGSVTHDSKGRKWVYVKANGTIGKGKMAKATSTVTPFTDVVIGTASAAATMVLGMTAQDLAAGDYAWIVASGLFEDDAVLISANVAPGDPFVCSAAGTCDIAAATDINNARGIVLVDGGSNAGSVLLY